MDEKATNELDELLLTMRPEQLKEYYKNNSKYVIDAKRAFYYYFKDVLEEKNIFLKDVYIRAGVSETQGSKIVRMEAHTKNRDLIIKLCIAGHLQVVELNRALKLYGMSPLYSKDKRDVCIITAVNNRIYDIYEINELLEAQGLEKFIINE